MGSAKEPSIFVGGGFEIGREMSSKGRGEKRKESRMGTRLSIGGAEKREGFHFAVIESKTCFVVMEWVRFAFERERECSRAGLTRIMGVEWQEGASWSVKRFWGSESISGSKRDCSANKVRGRGCGVLDHGLEFCHILGFCWSG